MNLGATCPTSKRTMVNSRAGTILYWHCWNCTTANNLLFTQGGLRDGRKKLIPKIAGRRKHERYTGHGVATLTGGLLQSLPCGVSPAVGTFLVVATTRPLPSAVRRGPLPPLLPTQAMPIYFLVGRLARA